MKFFLLLVLSWCVGYGAYAVPSRDEVYRSDRLKTVVYKDSQDAGIFWYIPPVKLYESDGKVVYYRRAKDDKVNYYFYVVPYITDDLIEMLAGEIPGLNNKTQLKPVLASKFGIQVKQFDALAMGDPVTDYQYLNTPQLVKISLPAKDADEFDFFIQNKPGVQANVLIHFDSERMDKYLNIELSYKEVYNALNIGGTGQYKFARAQIEAAITDYVSKKYFTVKSKGDLPIPEIVNKVIEECFTPYKKSDKKPANRYRDWEDAGDVVYPPKDGEAKALWEMNETTVDSMELMAGDGGWGPTGKDDPPWDDTPAPKKPTGPSGSSGGDAGGDLSVQFTFKKELANSDKTFFYKQEHFVDSSEIVSVPIFLSLTPSAVTSKVRITPLEKRDFVVEATNEAVRPFDSGLDVKSDEQYIINAVFAYSARSAYEPRLTWYRWATTWPSVDEDLYFRVGTGPWTKVNGRAVIKTEGIYKGPLQFSLDRKHIWDKIPSDFKDPKMIGLVPAIFTYAKTYPQFNVVVTGRKVEMNP